MKFIVSRSATSMEDCPCDEARIVKHQTKKGERVDAWTVELGTLQKFLNFVKKYGDVTIHSDGIFDNMKSP